MARDTASRGKSGSAGRNARASWDDPRGEGYDAQDGGLTGRAANGARGDEERAWRERYERAGHDDASREGAPRGGRDRERPLSGRGFGARPDGQRLRGDAAYGDDARDPRKAHGRHGATAHPDDAHDNDGHNVASVERLLSLAAGGALAWWGLKRRDSTGLGAGVVGGFLVERGMSGRCMVYDALGVNTAGQRADEPMRLHGAEATVDAAKATKIERAFTVMDRTPDELFAYWRKLENLPRIFRHLERVRELDARRSRWTAKGPAGISAEWDAEIVNEIPGKLLAWKSLPGSRIPNAGSIHFRAVPPNRGTEIRVVLEYEPPAGKLGVAVARLFGEEPAIQVREDLRRFKALMEAGELPVSYNWGQPNPGPRSFDAQVNRGVTGGDVRGLQREAAESAHEPRHQPQPADEMRGRNTTHDYQEPRA